jgi:hypothetical protein
MKKNELDFPKEWVELVKEAMKSGIKKEDFKKFLIEVKDKKENKGLTF